MASFKFANLVTISLIVVLHTFILQEVKGQFADLGYFDFTYDNPLLSVWNNNLGNRNPQTVQEVTRECSVNGVAGSATNALTGICMNSASCRFQRGKAIGRGTCSFWNTCCVFEKVSNQTSTSRITYFRSTSNARELPQPQRIYINLANRHICQMRVDILEMNLAVPRDLEPANINPACIDDYLQIQPPPSTQVPKICGKNKNTHFYVHIDNTLVMNNGIILTVKLGESTATVPLPAPSWNIKVTQLECPGARNLLEQHHNKNDKDQVVSDFKSLAPSGCLQYFTEKSGSFFNFGYASSTDSSLSTDLDYAVCFKPVERFCGLTFTNDFMKLNVPAGGPTPECKPSYIYIPEEETESKICALVQPPAMIKYTSKHPGPHYVHVHTDAMGEAFKAGEPYGFHFNYDFNVPCV